MLSGLFQIVSFYVQFGCWVDVDEWVVEVFDEVWQVGVVDVLEYVVLVVFEPVRHWQVVEVLVVGGGDGDCGRRDDHVEWFVLDCEFLCVVWYVGNGECVVFFVWCCVQCAFVVGFVQVDLVFGYWCIVVECVDGWV